MKLCPARATNKTSRLFAARASPTELIMRVRLFRPTQCPPSRPSARVVRNRPKLDLSRADLRAGCGRDSPRAYVPPRLDLAVYFFDLDDDEAVCLPNDAPAPSALRLVPRPDNPQGFGVVNLVLLGPRHLDDRDAFGSTALTSTCASRVHSALGHCTPRKSGTPPIVNQPAARPCRRSGAG